MTPLADGRVTVTATWAGAATAVAPGVVEGPIELTVTGAQRTFDESTVDVPGTGSVIMAIGEPVPWEDYPFPERPATLEAFRNHGQLRATLEDQVDDARHVIDVLERSGISLQDATDRLLEDGLTLFREAFDNLLAAVDKGRRSAVTCVIDRQTYTLPHELQSNVDAIIADWQNSGRSRPIANRSRTATGK